MKKKILIPMLIIMITVVSVGFAAWNIINQEKTRVPSEYFPYSVDYEQESVYDGTYQDIDIKFDNLDISLENSNLVILYYKYTYSVNEETGKVSHSLDKLDGKPKNHGTYIAKVYQKNGSEGSMDPISIANPYTEICNVRFDILQREVRVTALDEEIYFGQSKSDVTFDYIIEEADGDRGLIAGDVLTESSNFSLDVAYNTYDDVKDYDITISGLTNSDNNYNISYVPGTFTVKKLPISFTWDKTSTVYNGSYQRPTVIASTTINIDLNTVIANSSVDVIYNTDYNGQSTLIDANLNGYDVRCVGINNQNYEVVNYPNSIKYIIDQYPVNIKWENSEFTFNGKLQYQKANIITPLFYNEKDSKDDICNINYDTNGMINANVDKDGNSLPNNSQYIVNITGISNSNYKINASYSDYLSYAYYDIKPKLLTLAWPKENIFEYNNQEKIVQVLSEDIVSGYPSGLYYEGHQENANFVDANTQIEGSSKYYSVANITSTNYYLLDENATCEFRITQKEVFMNWDSKTQFEYAGQWEEDNSARKLHCPTGYLSEVIPGTDAGFSISGGQTNANHNHEGIKYDNFDDYVAVASISNSNYKLISNTTKAFEIWAYQAEVVIDNTKENAVLFTPFNTNGYDTLIYTYEALDFTPNASVTTHIFTGDICNVYVELLNTLGNYQLSVKDAGSYVAETTGLSNPNYSMVVKEYLNVVIEPKEINVLWGTDLENINDDLIFEYNSYPQIPVAVLDGVWDDDINDVSISVDKSYAQTNANVYRNETPELIPEKDYYTVSLTSDDDGYLLSGDRAFNYKFASTDECQATFMIKQAQLTISSKEKSITYGEAPIITDEDREITGLKDNDTLDVLVGLSSYVSYSQFDNVTDLDNGRTYYSVWKDVNNTNYDITYEEAQFIVNKLDVTINWYGDTTKVYYGEEWAPSVEVIGLVNNDPVTCIREGLEKDANIGNEKYTASVTGLSSENGKHVNYNVTNINTTQYYTITPRKITVAWSGYSNLEYNGDNHEITNTPSNIIPKDQGNIGYLVTYYNGTLALDAAPINAGTSYSAIATVESTNYYIETSNAKQPFEIAKRKITISWSGYSDLEYNGDNHEVTGTPSNIVPKDQGNIGYLVTYYNGTQALDAAPINAGTSYSAQATITSENYYIETLNATQTFEIAKRKLTINWTAPTSLTYDGDNKTYSTTLSNVVDGEQDTIGFAVKYYQGTSLLGTTAPINAGSSYSAQATITSENYYIEEANSKQIFEIAKRRLEITWVSEKTYNKTPLLPDYTFSNLVDGDLSSSLGIAFTGEYSSGVTNVLYDQNGNVRANLYILSLTGDNAVNYQLPTETIDFTVLPVPVEVTWNVDDLKYIASDIHPASIASGIIPGDTYTLSYNQQIKNAGTYENIVVTIDNRNYVITNGATIASITVDKAKLEISTNPTLATIYEGEASKIIGGAAAINGGNTIVTKDGYFVFDPNGSNGSDKQYYGSGKTAAHELQVKFVPNSDVAYNYYESDFVTVQMLIQAEASVGYQGTYYATVEDALDATVNATSETIIYILPIENDVLSYVPTITRNCTVGAKVTLLLPHVSSEITAVTVDENNRGYFTLQLGKDTPRDANGEVIYARNVMSTLEIIQNVTVTVKGTINVAANLYQGGYVGNHGVLMNYGTINVAGYINAYGYINGTGTINLSETSVYTDVFRLVNWPGGKNAYAMNNEKVLPFTVYSFHNVVCNVEINAGAIFQGYMNLEADDSWMLNKMIGIIGNSSSESCFFKLSSGSVSKKTKDAFGNDSFKTDYLSDNQLTSQKEMFEFNGIMTDGKISIEAVVSVPVLGSLPVNIATGTDLPVPIGFFEIYIKSGSLSITQTSYKFLPGSLLRVGEDATMNIGAGVQARFYDEYLDDFDYYNGEDAPRENGYETAHSYRYHHSDWYAQKNSLGDEFGGRLVVEGKMICNGSISGNIKGSGNGMIDVKGETSTNIKLLKKLHYNGGMFGKLSSVELKDDKQYMIGTINGIENQQFVKGNTYYYNSQKECWGTGTITISFETNCSQTINDYVVYGSSAGHNIPENVLNSLENRDHYEEYKWYTDPSFTSEYTGQTLYANTTLYAKWIGEEYTVSFDTNGEYSVQSITVRYGEQYGSLPVLFKDGYDFNGWKYNGDIVYNNTKVTATSDHTLVADWEQIASVQYTVNLYDVDGEVIETFKKNEGSVIGTLQIPTKTGYTFKGWKYEDGSPVTSTDLVNSDINVYATWEGITYNVTFDKNGGDTEGTTTATVVFGTTPGTIDTLPTKKGYTFNGYWSSESGGTQYYKADGSGATDWNLPQNTRLYAHWDANKYTVTLTSNEVAVTPSQIEVTYGKKYSTLPTPSDTNDYTFKGWKDENGNEITSSDTVSIAKNHTLTAKWEKKSSGCFATGTMINMADGTMKAIEDIKVGDKVLVMNHLTGKVEVSVISINVHDNITQQYYDVLDLEFSNGTTITIANDHGFFDITLGKYVAISLSNYHDYLGHEFYYYDVESNTTSKVTLVSGTIENRYCQVFAPFTYEHLNLFAEGLLTLTGEVVELYNAFDFDETASYDKESMEADIEKYGLYTYEDFKDYATEEEFNAFNAKYFKIAVGKGLLTYEQVLYYIQTYLRD